MPSEPPMSSQPEAGEVPTCYRHAGRETYVRCVRCERSICPDCMISAAVGFQCPRCVHEGNKNVREARTVSGGVVRSETGLITSIILAINVVLFLAVQPSVELLNRLVLVPYAATGDGVAQDGWHRLITAAFLHEQTLHLLLNMLVLWLFGRPLEAQLGRSRYAATYLTCALGGSTASYLFNDPRTGSLGASGAVFGLIGALLVLERRIGSNPSGVLVYLGILLLPGLVLDNIDWRGHVGGLLTGGLLGALFVYGPRARRAWWQGLAFGVLLVAMTVAIFVRTDRLNTQVREQFGVDLAAGAAIAGARGPGVIPTGDNACGELHMCN
ncbi:MAG: rhomboid family intramembrane serine protease [Sporichthyaceae bacterium]